MAGACPGARSLTLQNLTTAKEISSGAADFCTKDLLVVPKCLDGMAQKLSELNKGNLILMGVPAPQR
ncbi:unnamed protein product [Symbiodinium natans]|uniref:Uncharacterized protein n=1 Tax=Symbiodinium natans TaxID=878477 RepID=A0A812GW60_9DINO|nr:unnamed protein product [Symbiodinium natans]